MSDEDLALAYKILSSARHVAPEDPRDVIFGYEPPMDLLKPAHALAKEYGHTWGNIEIRSGMSLYDIRDESWIYLQNGKFVPCNPGILCPTMALEDGVLCHKHTTATGRLTWFLYEDGSIWAYISRPSCDMYVARYHKQWEGTAGKIDITSREYMEDRHAAAMLRFIKTVNGGFKGIKTYCPDLWDEYMDRYERGEL
jgi:hypothetical protein